MLRITMLKLKRAWSIALTLRHKGDTRHPGKFHRLMMVRSAQKSTNTDKDNEWKCKQIIDYLFSPLRTHNEIRRIQCIIINDIRRLQRAIKKQKAIEDLAKIKPNANTICPKAHREKCDKLINNIFGEQKSLTMGNVSNVNAAKVRTVFSTTAKQTEEQLAQKVEVIDETPLVEAAKPKNEGFNTPPRVLGQNSQRSNSDTQQNESPEKIQKRFKNMVRRLENSEILGKVSPATYGVVNYSSQSGKSGGASGGDKQDEYDSIAKRHLNTPHKQLEGHLIQDMQKLGVPDGFGNSSSFDAQMNSTKKPKTPSAKIEIELEARKYNNESPPGFHKHQISDSARTANIRTLQAVPIPSHLSKLHEEGIRYIEQTTSIDSEKRNTSNKKTRSKPENNTASQNKPSGLTTSTKTEQSSPTHTLNMSTNELNAWSGKYPCSPPTSVYQQLYCQRAYQGQKPPYDPYKPIIDPHDKKNIASDPETYGYGPLRNYRPYYTNQHGQTELPKNANQIPGADSGIIKGIHLNRNMPYYYNYIQNFMNPNQKNKASSPEGTATENQSKDYITEQNKADNANTILEPQQKTDSAFPSNQSSAMNPNVTYPDPNLHRNMPYYYNYYQHYTYPGHVFNQHVHPSSQDKHLTFENTESTQEDKNIKKPETPEQSPTDSQISNYNNYLNRDKPYYYNRHYTYLSQIPSQQDTWPNFKNYDCVSPNPENVIDKTQLLEKSHIIKKENSAIEQSQPTNQSLPSNENPKWLPEETKNEMGNLRNMPYYSNIYSHPTKLGIEQSQATSQSLKTNENSMWYPEETKNEIENLRNFSYYSNIYTQVWRNPKEHTGIVHEQERDGLDPNQMYVDAYTDVHATRMNSDFNPSGPHTRSQNTDNKDGLKKDLHVALMSGADGGGFPHHEYPNANPQNIVLDQNIGDPSHDHTLQSSHNPGHNPPPQQQEAEVSKENDHVKQQQITTNTNEQNPDKIILAQNTGNPSYDYNLQSSNPSFNQHLQQQLAEVSKKNHHVNQQRTPENTNPENPENIILNQNIGDPSYDYKFQSSHNPVLNPPLQQQESEASNKKNHDHLQRRPAPTIPENMYLTQSTGDQYIQHYRFNPWRNPSYQPDLPQKTPAVAEKLPKENVPKEAEADSIVLDQNTGDLSFENTNKTQNPSVPPLIYPAPDSQPAVHQNVYQNYNPFQQPSTFVGNNPYAYHHSHTLYGDSSNQQSHSHENQKSFTEKPSTQPNDKDNQQLYQHENQQSSANKSTSAPDEKDLRLSNLEKRNIQQLTGSSAGFVSLPKPKWEAGASEQEETVPEEKVQVGAEGTISPLPEIESPLPKGDDIPLSELLRRVRERNSRQYTKLAQVDTTEGKCGTKKPPCPPPPPAACPPKLPKKPKCPPPPPSCPRPCKPKCPPIIKPKRPSCPPKDIPACKCTAISLKSTIHNIFSVICDSGSHRLVHSIITKFSRPEYSTKAIMTEDVVTRFKLLGDGLCTTNRSDLGMLCQRLETLAMVRGFEPWVPVPSWPFPIKKKNKPFVGPKEGCKQRPPPTSHDTCDPPCVSGNPCRSFPNKYRNN